MPDSQNVDELSLEELEYIVAERRREERERRFAESGNPRYKMRERQPKKKRSANPPRRWRDRLLLVIEVIAALGLIAIIAMSLLNLQTLNQDIAQARGGTSSTGAIPQPTGDLPGSSFPPSSDLTELPGSSFPPDLAPPALGVRLQKVAALPIPTLGPRSPTRVAIPVINVDWPIVPGDSWEELKQGVGHHIGSANPGERGNLVLSGHDDVYGEPFRDLEKLDVGKEVMVYAGANVYRYVIKAKRIVAPNDLSVLEASRSPIITLITCTPYRVDTQRLILIGDLKP